jgi:hypothetical protein
MQADFAIAHGARDSVQQGDARSVQFKTQLRRRFDDARLRLDGITRAMGLISGRKLSDK